MTKERARRIPPRAATERRFYDQEGGGMRDVVEWYKVHRAHSVWRRAAGVYIYILSEPQLCLSRAITALAHWF